MYGTMVVGAEICLVRVPARDPSVLFYLPEAGNSSTITKLVCFDLNITTDVDCYGNVSCGQSRGHYEVGISTCVWCVFSSCFLHEWRSRLKMRHNVVQGNLTSLKTNHKNVCKRM